MSYKETLEFLYQQLPMYSRIGSAAYKKDLTNTLRLCELTGHPENKFKSVHIAGTNGKGSTSHMLAAIFQQCGYKTGLYTSPHLKDFRERIRINGAMISEEAVIHFVEKYKEEVMKIGCSFFEWSVGLAFDFFSREAVDIAVIETGLGGRLDSTNVITPLLSVITNVSYDHTEMLGDTLEKIAFEKAGIIKPNVPVVIGERHPDTDEVFAHASQERHAPISFAQDEWKFISSIYQENSLLLQLEDFRCDRWTVTSDLVGSYQEKNVLTVLEAIRKLKGLGWQLEKEEILNALKNVKGLTGLRGRWDILAHQPLTITDVAHNEAGLGYALEQLKTYSFKHLHLVIGFVKEKELDKILKLFPKNATYYFCAPDIPRGLNVNILKEAALAYGLTGEAYHSVQAAFAAAKKQASPDDLIYVGGSTFVVSEAI